MAGRKDQAGRKQASGRQESKARVSAKARVSVSISRVRLSLALSKLERLKKHRSTEGNSSVEAETVGSLPCLVSSWGCILSLSFIQYLLSTCYMPGTVLGVGDTVENRRPCLIF